MRTDRELLQDLLALLREGKVQEAIALLEEREQFAKDAAAMHVAMKRRGA